MNTIISNLRPNGRNDLVTTYIIEEERCFLSVNVLDHGDGYDAKIVEEKTTGRPFRELNFTEMEFAFILRPNESLYLSISIRGQDDSVEIGYDWNGRLKQTRVDTLP